MRRQRREDSARYDERRCQDRWRVKAAFCRLEDFRHAAAHYDKLAADFAPAIALATVVALWS